MDIIATAEMDNGLPPTEDGHGTPELQPNPLLSDPTPEHNDEDGQSRTDRCFERQADELQSGYTLLNLDDNHVYNYDFDNHDNDQTFCKTIFTPSLQQTGDNLEQQNDDKGDNSNAAYLGYQGYPSSPQLNPDGNIQCAQSAQLSAFPSSLPELDKVLENLPKDTYITTLLEQTNSSEETLSSYRSELANRAKLCENGPKGTLKERRNSVRGSAAEKYAHECFVLNQFILGNKSDIGFLFKTPPGQVIINDTSRPANACDCSQEINALKNNFSRMQTDVHLLKAETKDIRSSIESLTTNMQSELASMKNVLHACESVLHEHLQINDTNTDSKIHTHIKTVLNHINKLETHRISMKTDILDVSNRADNNSLNISKIFDHEEKNKKSVKLTLKDYEERFDEKINKVNSNCKTAHQSTSETISSKLNQLNPNTLQAATRNTLEHSIKDMTAQLCAKFDSIQETLQSSIEKSISKSLANHDTLPKPTYSSLLGPQINSDRPQSVPTIVPESKGYLKNQSNANGSRQKVYDNHSNRDVHAPSYFQENQNIGNLSHGLGNHRFNNRIAQSSNEQYIDLVEPNQNDNEPNGQHKVDATTIPVVITIDRNEEDNLLRDTTQNTNGASSRFKGVIRKRAKSYYITGIDLQCDQEGLEQFLEDKGIVFRSAKFLYSRRTDCKSAQIVVSDDQSALVEDRTIWPENILCRPWMKRSEYRSRWQEETRSDRS